MIAVITRSNKPDCNELGTENQIVKKGSRNWIRANARQYGKNHQHIRIEYFLDSIYGDPIDTEYIFKKNKS